MGKNKEKIRSKGSDDVLLETSLSCIMTQENPEKDKLGTDPGVTEKAKKKRKRKDSVDQQCENAALQTEDYEEHRKQKKRKKSKGEKATCEDAHDAHPDVELVDGSLDDESSFQSSPKKKKKKKKKEKKRDSGVVVVHEEREGDVTRTREVEEANVKMKSGEGDGKSSRKSDEPVRKKKKKNETKSKDRSDSVEMGADPVTEAVETALNKNDENVMPERSITSELVGTRTKRKRKRDGEEEFEEIDPHLLERLKKFVPDVDKKCSHNVGKMIVYDLPRFEEFRKKGIPLNLKRFTAKENERLKKNVADFMALTGIDNATKLFFTDRFKEEKQNIAKLKKLHRFYESIAEGIPKSCQYVYARGRRVFDERSYKGVFSKREMHTLQKLHTLHGGNWKKISELTGRSAYSLQKRFAHFNKQAGTWSWKEVQRLLRAVRNYVVSQLEPGADRAPREILYKNLPWKNIAEEVKTRSWSKCREKWLSILPVKMACVTVPMEKSEEIKLKIKLIKVMYEMQLEDVAYVNWEDLTKLVGDVPPSYMQKKWHRLKVCYVPQWQTKCFADIIDFLYENVLSRLVKELKESEDAHDAQMKNGQNESFLLSDIFQDITNENVDDDDKDRNNDNGKEQ